MFPRTKLALVLALTSGVSLLGADLALTVTEKNYLGAQGFSVFLYDSTYHPVFVDQKNTAMELILHDRRIATNGDVRLMPTPEQWDLVATLKGRHIDKATQTLSAALAFPTFDLSYKLEVTPEPGGVKISIHLDKPLPASLADRAGFNLEFLPAVYSGKAYLVDGTQAGIFPRFPQGPMVTVTPLADEPKKASYLEQWDQIKGHTQPLPFAVGKTITLGVDDPLARISVTSDTADLMLFDGRSRAQNGWFVLRSLIPAGKTTNAIVWHVRPDVVKNWIRPPMIAHSQVGYAPEFEKIAVLELDPNDSGPQTAKVLRLMQDGSFTPAYEGPITAKAPWLRYTYAKFDFTSVKEPGLYVIEYADQRTAAFPIASDAYANIWKPSLSHHIPIQMDHVSVREGYRVWHGASHLDDAILAPVVGEQFDGWNQATATDGKYAGGDRIPGMNVGGWYDAGDFDLEQPAQLAVIQNLALAYREFDLKFDATTVDERARAVELHRPDGIPDAVQQVKHGASYILAQFRAFGHSIRGTHEPDLRQYTHLGDGATKTDGRIYDPRLGLDEVKGDFSGRPDDRWIFSTTNPFFQWGSIAGLAAAADTLKGWDDAMAKECLETAIEAWHAEKSNPTKFPANTHFGGDPEGAPAAGVLAASQGALAGSPASAVMPQPTPATTPSTPPSRWARMRVGVDWNAALELTIATRGADPFKSRLKELLPQMIAPEQIEFRGWMAVRALAYFNTEEKSQIREAVKTYMARLDKELGATPFGVPPSLRTWGGSGEVVDMAIRMYFLHRAFPDLVSPQYSLRAVNYILGTHPVNSTSYVGGVGTVSKSMTYSFNRGDHSYIPGAVVPGYVIIKPDFPESLDDFGFLWFEHEAVIAGSASWVVAGKAASALTQAVKH